MKRLTLPSQNVLRRMFFYDPKTGTLIDRITGGEILYRVCIGEGLQQKSRVIWKWMTGEDPPITVDHKDRNRKNCRWENLRAATYSQQNTNRKLRKNAVGHKGVYRNKKGYRAAIFKDGKFISLGTFDTIESAVAARQSAVATHYGEYADAP